MYNHDLDMAEFARLEEGRQAQGTVEAVKEFQDNFPASHTAITPLAGGWMTFVEPGHHWNQALGVGLQGDCGRQEVSRLIEFYEARGAQPRIVVSSFCPQELLDALAARQFVVCEIEHVYIRPLHNPQELAQAMPYPIPPGLSITRVDPCDTAQVHDFAEVSSSGFRPPGPLPAVTLHTTKALLANPRCDGFIATLHGQAVGGGCMESSHGFSSLFSASVLPPFRRQGIQCALILGRLTHALQREAHFGSIHAKPNISTARNALRLGFHVAYTKITMTRPPH